MLFCTIVVHLHGRAEIGWYDLNGVCATWIWFSITLSQSGEQGTANSNSSSSSSRAATMWHTRGMAEKTLHANWTSTHIRTDTDTRSNAQKLVTCLQFISLEPWEHAQSHTRPHSLTPLYAYTLIHIVCDYVSVHTHVVRTITHWICMHTHTHTALFGRDDTRPANAVAVV